MVRPATVDDVPAIVAMAARFYPTTHYADWCEMDEDTARDLITSLLTHHVLLVSEVDGELAGMVGLYVGPFMFNKHRTGAYEVVWWVAPEHRGGGLALSLLKHAERAAQARGAGRIEMAHMPNSPPQAAGLYERMGYARSVISYTKDI